MIFPRNPCDHVRAYRSPPPPLTRTRPFNALANAGNYCHACVASCVRRIKCDFDVISDPFEDSDIETTAALPTRLLNKVRINYGTMITIDDVPNPEVQGFMEDDPHNRATIHSQTTAGTSKHDPVFAKRGAPNLDGNLKVYKGYRFRFRMLPLRPSCPCALRSRR